MLTFLQYNGVVELLRNYIELGIVLSPIQGERYTYPEWRGLPTTSPQEVDSWVVQGNKIGIATGRYSRQVALEVRSMRGFLLLSAWSRGREVKTWEYMSQGSYFMIFKLPEKVVTKRQATFFTEQNHEMWDAKKETFLNPKIKAFTPHRRAETAPDDAALIIWGDDHAVPLPDPQVGRHVNEVRPPATLAHLGGLPDAPPWLVRAIEANTYPTEKEDEAHDISDALFFLSRNTFPSSGSVWLRTLYEAYIQETFELGAEPLSERLFAKACRVQGYEMERKRRAGKMGTFIVGLEPVPFSRLWTRLRS